MHKEILTENQTELLPFIISFKREFYLVGGTAIALHLGHRRSVDFDLFKLNSFDHKKIKERVYNLKFKKALLHEEADQIHFNINNTKVTFFNYTFDIAHPCKFENIISLPELLDLSAMKAYALGRRAKWKDYVDLFFIIKLHYTIKQISKKASEYFGDLFSEKLFRQQLIFFDDIDYSEEVEFMQGFEVSPEEVKAFLIDVATEPF